MQSSNHVYIERIDVLRFVAATLVVFWHFLHLNKTVPLNYVPRFFFLSIFTEGHTGVSLFMVLSGFIFQYINAGKELIYSKFLRNRFFRIFPLAIFWTLVLVAADHLNSVEALLNTIFVFNSKSVPGIGWTIVVEFQFYLIFPIFHKIIEKKSGIYNILGLIVLMIMVRSILFVNIDNLRDFSYFTIFGRLDQFLIGMIFAKLYTSGHTAEFFSKPVFEKIRLLLLSISVVALLLFFRLYNLWGGLDGSTSTHLKSASWIIFLDLEALFHACVIVLFLSINKYALLNPIEKILARIGELSYSMYWLHWPIAKAIGVLLHRFNFFWPGPFRTDVMVCILIILPVTIFVSFFSYRFFEKPFLEFRQKYTS